MFKFDYSFTYSPKYSNHEAKPSNKLKYPKVYNNYQKNKDYKIGRPKKYKNQNSIMQL